MPALLPAPAADARYKSTVDRDLEMGSAVIAFVALGGITGEESRLWTLAHNAGMTLEEFVTDVISHTLPAYEFCLKRVLTEG